MVDVEAFRGFAQHLLAREPGESAETVADFEHGAIAHQADADRRGAENRPEPGVARRQLGPRLGGGETLRRGRFVRHRDHHRDDRDAHGEEKPHPHPGLAALRRQGLVLVDLRDHHPVGAVDAEGRGQHRRAAIVMTVDHAEIAAKPRRRRQPRSVERQAEGEGSVLAVPERRNEQHLVAIAARQQGLRRGAGGRPALQQRIQVGVGIDLGHQHESRGAERRLRAVREQRRDDVEPGSAVLLVQLAEDRHAGLPRLGQRGDGLRVPGPVRDRPHRSHDAAGGVHHLNVVKVAGFQEDVHPHPHLVERAVAATGKTRGLQVPVAHCVEEGGIAREQPNVGETVGAPLADFIELEDGDAGQRFLGLDTALVFLAAQVLPANHRDHPEDDQ